MAHAASPNVADLSAGDALSIQQNIAAVIFLHARDAVGEIVLSVALNAGDSEDFTFSDGEGDMVKHNLSFIGELLKIFHLEDRLSGLRIRFLNLQNDISSNHQAGKLAFIKLRDGVGAIAVAVTQDRDVVAQLHDFLQLMGYEDDGMPALFQKLQLLEQLLRLLRSQDRRRLIENQDLRASCKRLENLNLLHQADGELADRCGGIKAKLILV